MYGDLYRELVCGKCYTTLMMHSICFLPGKWKTSTDFVKSISEPL